MPAIRAFTCPRSRRSRAREIRMEKVRDVVGLYMNPPDHAVVLCVDEKSQIQALDRRQPVLPMVFGLPERATPTNVRHGTTTLFAALDVATGKVIGECYPKHRSSEFRRFFQRIDAEVPAELDVHVIVDNYATHSHPTVKRWLVATSVSTFTLPPRTRAG
jgi:hypothetical protein